MNQRDECKRTADDVSKARRRGNVERHAKEIVIENILRKID